MRIKVNIKTIMNANDQSIASNTQSTSVSHLGDFELHPPTKTVKQKSKPILRDRVIPLNQYLVDQEGPKSILTVHIKNNNLTLFDGEITK